MTAPTEADLAAIQRLVADEVARQLVPALREVLASSRPTEDMTRLDAAIRAGDVEVVGAGPVRLLPSTIEDDLEALNRRARSELDRERYPEPEGCPPAGVWLRLVSVDRDNRGAPAGAWHMSHGWQPTWGRLQSRCGHPRNMWAEGKYSTRLLVSRELPASHVCRKCIELVAKDRDLT